MSITSKDTSEIVKNAASNNMAENTAASSSTITMTTNTTKTAADTASTVSTTTITTPSKAEPPMTVTWRPEDYSLRSDAIGSSSSSHSNPIASLVMNSQITASTKSQLDANLSSTSNNLPALKTKTVENSWLTNIKPKLPVQTKANFGSFHKLPLDIIRNIIWASLLWDPEWRVVENASERSKTLILHRPNPGFTVTLSHTAKFMRIFLQNDPQLQDRLRFYLATSNSNITVFRPIYQITEPLNRVTFNLTDAQRGHLGSAIVKNKIRRGLNFGQVLNETNSKKISRFRPSQIEALRLGFSIEQARNGRLTQDIMTALKIIMREKIKESTEILKKEMRAFATPNDQKELNDTFKKDAKAQDEKSKTETETISLSVEQMAAIDEEAYKLVLRLTPHQIAGINEGHPYNLVLKIPMFILEHAAACNKGHKPEDIRDFNYHQLHGLFAGLTRGQILSAPLFSQAHLDAIAKKIAFDQILDLNELQVRGIIAGFLRKHVKENKEFSQAHIDATTEGFSTLESGDLSCNELQLLKIVPRKEMMDSNCKVEPYHINACLEGMPYPEIRGLNAEQIVSMQKFKLSREQVTLDSNKNRYNFGAPHLAMLEAKGKANFENIRGLNQFQVSLMSHYALSREETLKREQSPDDENLFHTARLADTKFDCNEMGITADQREKFNRAGILSEVIKVTKQYPLLKNDFKTAHEYYQNFLDLQQNQVEALVLGDRAKTYPYGLPNPHRIKLQKKAQAVKTYQELQTYCRQMIALSAEELEAWELGMSLDQISEYKKTYKTYKAISSVQIEALKVGASPQQIVEGGIRAEHLAFVKKKALNDKKEIQELFTKISGLSGLELDACECGMDSKQISEYKKRNGYIGPDQIEALKMGALPQQIAEGGIRTEHLTFIKKKSLNSRKEAEELFAKISGLSGVELDAFELGITREQILQMKKLHFHLTQEFLEILKKTKDLPFEKILKKDREEASLLLDALAKGFSYSQLQNLKVHQLRALSISHELTLEQVAAVWFTPQHFLGLVSCSYNTIEGLNPTQLQGVLAGLEREEVLPGWFTKRHLDAFSEGVPYKAIRGTTPEAVEKIWREFVAERVKAEAQVTSKESANNSTVMQIQTQIPTNTFPATSLPTLTPMYAMTGTANTSSPNNLTVNLVVQTTVNPTVPGGAYKK